MWPSLEEYIAVKYKLKSSDNFDEYLKRINVGLILRKVAQASSPTCFMERDGDIYTITMVAPVRTIRTSFRIGEEFDEDRADGVKVKSTFTIEGNKLIQKQIESCGRQSLHIREFTPEKLTVTSTIDGWEGKCVRIYERLQ